MKQVLLIVALATINLEKIMDDMEEARLHVVRTEHIKFDNHKPCIAKEGCTKEKL